MNKFKRGQKVVCLSNSGGNRSHDYYEGQIYTVTETYFEGTQERIRTINELGGKNGWVVTMFEDAAPTLAKREFNVKFEDFIK